MPKDHDCNSATIANDADRYDKEKRFDSNERPTVKIIALYMAAATRRVLRTESVCGFFSPRDFLLVSRSSYFSPALVAGPLTRQQPAITVRRRCPISFARTPLSRGSADSPTCQP